MFRSRNKKRKASQIAIFLLCSSLLTIYPGCATTPGRAISNNNKVKIVKIGIVPASVSPKLEAEYSKSRFTCAAREIGNGGRKGLKLWGDWIGDPRTIFYIPVFVGIGGLAGGVHGAAKPDRVEDQKLKHHLEKAITGISDDGIIYNTDLGLQIQARMAENLFNMGSAETDCEFTILIEQKANCPDKKLSYLIIKAEGLDAVLESEVVQLGFNREGKGYSNLALFMTVHIRLIRLEDETVIRSKKFKCKSEKYARWD